MLLGVDCGCTAVKAVVFDDRGNTIAAGSRRTEPLAPAPNRVEHGRDRLWQPPSEAIADALRAVPEGARAVDAVGVTAHGDGLYLSDAAGAPLGNGIQSVDSRARGVTAAWASAGVLERVETISGQRPYPYAATAL